MTTKTPVKPKTVAPKVAEHFAGNDFAESEGEGTARVFAPRPKLTMIPTERIDPSPLNPRKHFEEAALAELAASIKVHGVQQPLVVRQTVRDEGTAGGVVTYSIVMGERRWRAARLAGLGNVPCIVRTDIDDKSHAVLAMEENERRSDLTPIERARGYRQCLDLGTTQAELGEKIGHGQAFVSNALGLLELPEYVQAMIGDGRLSATHGRGLRHWKAVPALACMVAAEAVENGRSSKALESGELEYSVTQKAIRRG